MPQLMRYPLRGLARHPAPKPRTAPLVAILMLYVFTLCQPRTIRAQATTLRANQQTAASDQKAQVQPQAGQQPKTQQDNQEDQNPYPNQLNLELHTPPEQAKALLSSIDGLLNFSSEHSGLPIRSKVQGQLIDRKGVKERREKDLSKEDVIVRLRRSSLILKKLGLVPRDFDLRSFALDSPDDPLAGFYDPATRIFYMLDWVPAEGQYPVMAHELTHALQDQYVGLEKWMKIPGTAGNTDDESDDNGRDETSVARRAVAEGQATAVMLDYVLAPYGRTLASLPSIDESTIQNLMQRRTSPALLRAPRYIRESAVFPYVYGLAFIHEVLKKNGKERAFSGVLKNPPQNSRQVMHPSTYLTGERIAPLPLPPLAPALASGFERLDSGTFGEFDALMFAEQYTTAQKARQISTLWRGGYYYAAEKPAKAETVSSNIKVATTVPVDDPGAVGFLLVSRWATPVAAREFADLYAASVSERYAGATRQPNPAKPTTAGERSLAWQTTDGLVFVETRGALVLAMETFDTASAARLRAIVMQSSGTPQH